jgi:acyl-CoA thioesterase FadM
MTARMHVRFRRSVPLGQRLRVRGYITNRRQRLIQARAEVRDENGALLAEGEGAFLRVTPEEGRKFEEIFRARAGTPGRPV